MKVEIRVGDVSSKKRIAYSFEKHDNISEEKSRMYEFLNNCNDCIVENVDCFLLYTLNNGLMAFIVKDNIQLQKEEYEDEECRLIPKFNPKKYKVFEIKEDGTEICIQNKEGDVMENYFDILMGGIMNDYYFCINFYEPLN